MPQKDPEKAYILTEKETLELCLALRCIHMMKMAETERANAQVQAQQEEGSFIENNFSQKMSKGVAERLVSSGAELKDREVSQRLITQRGRAYRRKR